MEEALARIGASINILAANGSWDVFFVRKEWVGVRYLEYAARAMETKRAATLSELLSVIERNMDDAKGTTCSKSAGSFDSGQEQVGEVYGGKAIAAS